MQHDYILSDAAGASVRGDINNALGAIATMNSGATAPATTYAYMLWADTTTGLLKQRDSSNASWITIGELDAAYFGIVAGVQATIQDGSENYLGTLTGTNTITATASPTLTAQMATGSRWTGLAAAANTGAATINVDGQGAVSLVRPDGTALQASDIPAAGYPCRFLKRAADVVLLNPANLSEEQGANIASTSTINLDTATGNYVHVTGTTAITAITLSQGRERTVVFDGALTLTNGASLILPGGANITTAAGDASIFRGEAAGVVRCIAYIPASGYPLLSGFGSSLASSGYQKLPSGLIMQWGKVTGVASASETTVTFPIAFPNACLNASATVLDNASTSTMNAFVVFSAPTTTQLVLTNGGGITRDAYWFAIGH